jgi:hypothetical protein
LAKRILALFALLAAVAYAQPAPQRPLQFLFTSDAHYGLTRSSFRGHSNVDAHAVNAAMVAAMNRVPGSRLPEDGGVGAGQLAGPIDFVAETGDIANREETTGGADGHAVQSAAASWRQFRADYIDGLTVKNAAGTNAPLFLVPGNHDVSNAVGFYKPMMPATDTTAMVEIYNLMVKPPVPRTPATYRYDTDRVLASRDVDGVHLMFLNVWPDSKGRAWMAQDLERVGETTPVFLFTHDQPDAEPKHFINPNGRHDINAVDKFENLLSDRLADGRSVDDASILEQRALEGFLRTHPNVRAYFHGNSNWTEFYDWHGPDRSISLPVFRVDSPMKGNVSAKDERKLAFELASVDVNAKRLTVRECLWNTDPEHPEAPLVWGSARTVSIASVAHAAKTASR